MFSSTLFLAFISSNIIALVAGPLGCFVVWRRLAFFGDSLAHSILLGIALSLLWSFNLSISVVATAIMMSLILYYLQRRTHVATDALLGFISHSFIALGIVAFALLSDRIDTSSVHDHGSHSDHSEHSASHDDHDDHEGHDHGDHSDEDSHEGHDHGDHSDEDSHAGHDHGDHGDGNIVINGLQESGHGDLHFEEILFGDIVGLSSFDVLLLFIFGIFAFVSLLFLWRPLFASGVSGEIASVEYDWRGRYCYLIFVILLAILVALSVQLIGVLLISSLLIIPPIAVRIFSRSPEQMAILSTLVCLLSVNLGLLISEFYALPTGATIVAVAFFLSLLCLLLKQLFFFKRAA